MPIKRKKIEKPEYYIIIPGFKKYLLSQTGNVYYKRTWNIRKTFKRGKSDFAKITDVTGKQFAFNITKAVKIYFSDLNRVV